MPGRLAAMIAASRPPCVSVTSGGAPNSRSWTAFAVASTGDAMSGTPARVPAARLVVRAGQPRGAADLREHLGHERRRWRCG